MKKINAIGFAILYVFLVSGNTLCFHYCGGKIVSVNIPMFIHVNACYCEKEIIKSGCCEKQHISLILYGEQKPSSVVSAQIDSFKVFAGQYMAKSEDLLPLHNFSIISDYRPPSVKSNNSLLIWNQVFRI